MNFQFMIFILLLCMGLATSQGYEEEYDYPESALLPADVLRDVQENSFLPTELYEIHQINNELNSVITENRRSLDVLFNSTEKSEDLTREISKTNYWLLDEAVAVIEEELEKNYNISENDVVNIQNVVKHIKLKMETWPSQPQYKRMIFPQLNESRPLVDWALGRHSRNGHFNSIENSFVADEWKCRESIPDLWKELIGLNYSNSNYSLKQAMEMLMAIVQVARIEERPDTQPNKKLTEIRLQLIMMLSDETIHQFVTPIFCKKDQNCAMFFHALCGQDLFQVVTDMMKKLEVKSKEDILSNSKDLMVFLDILKKLGDVTKNLTTVATIRSNRQAQKNARKVLAYYLGIMNVAIGTNSSVAWTQTSLKTAVGQFEQMLIDNDEYVGYISDMLLFDNNTDQVNESSVTVQIRRTDSTSDTKVKFNFGNVQIWADSLNIPPNSSANSSVYALYYKTWNDVMQNITEHFQSNGSSTKKLIGKGGVVSLTSRITRTKHSIPVSFRINFDDSSLFYGQNGKRLSRCLSCGFFNITSKSWKSDGCYVVSVDDVGVTCHCNHTTNFAAFMSPYENVYAITDDEDLWLNIFEYIGSITSVFGLLISFAVFYVVRNAVRNDRLRAHMNLVAALLFVHVIQIGAEFAVQDDRMCLVTTLATHYFLLASFMWMLVEGIFLYLYIIQVFVRSRTENKKWMYIIGWFVPLAIVAVSAGVGLSDNTYINPNKEFLDQCEKDEMLYPRSQGRKYETCWLDSLSGMTWSFVGPAILVILINLVILCKVVMALSKLSERNRRMKKFQTQDQARDSKKPNGTPKLLSYKTRNYQVQSDGKVSWFRQDPSNPDLSGLPSYCHQLYLDHQPVLTFNSNRGKFLKEVRRTVKGAVVLLPLLGISWIIGVFAYKSFVISLLFVFLNSIQGVAIFLIYCVFNGEVYRALQRRLSSFCVGRKGIIKKRSVSSGSVKSVLSISMLKNWNRRSTSTPVYRSNNPV